MQFTWLPLEKAVGKRLCTEFTYVGQTRTPDGLVLHRYRHYRTRRCLILSAQGTTWKQTQEGYVPDILENQLARVLEISFPDPSLVRVQWALKYLGKVVREQWGTSFKKQARLACLVKRMIRNG